MKILLILFVFLSTLFSNELLWVDKQINSILPDRKGIDKKQINFLKSPFVTLLKSNKNEIKKNYKINKRRYKSKKVYFNLGAIMNNSALINGHWYKTGKKINGYKIKIINNASVILVNKNKTFTLTTKSKKSTLNILK